MFTVTPSNFVMILGFTILLAIMLFGFSRVIYALLVGLILFVFKGSLSNWVGQNGVVILSCLVSLFLVVGALMDTYAGRDILHELAQDFRGRPLFVITAPTVFVIIGFFLTITFGLSSVCTSTLIILSTFFFVATPRAMISVALNWLIVHNATLIISSGEMFSVYYGMSLVLTFIALAIDLREARHYLWPVKTHEKEMYQGSFA